MVRKKMLYSSRVTGNLRSQQTYYLEPSEEKGIPVDPVGWQKVSHFKEEFFNRLGIKDGLRLKSTVKSVLEMMS